MEYLASKFTNEYFDMNYTVEKKAALRRALSSHSYVIDGNLSNITEIQAYLDDKLTLQDLHIKAALQRLARNLRYEKELLTNFKEELNK